MTETQAQPDQVAPQYGVFATEEAAAQAAFDYFDKMNPKPIAPEYPKLDRSSVIALGDEGTGDGRLWLEVKKESYHPVAHIHLATVNVKTSNLITVSELLALRKQIDQALITHNDLTVYLEANDKYKKALNTWTRERESAGRAAEYAWAKAQRTADSQPGYDPDDYDEDDDEDEDYN